MLIDLFLRSPGVALAWLAVIVMALSIHEFAHALVAHLKGDSTAEQHGRLTLNPLAHLDPVGLIPLILFGFGWAKPVPFNPYHFKNPRIDSLLVSLAGPGSNLVLAAVSGLVFRGITAAGGDFGLLPVFLIISTLVNLMLFFFNLVPIYPLDGSKMIDAIFVKPQHHMWVQRLKVYGPQVLMVLVLISLFTNIDTFFFVSIPAQLACYGFTGTACFAQLASEL
jgi:Zn-dependent protease